MFLEESQDWIYQSEDSLPQSLNGTGGIEDWILPGVRYPTQIQHKLDRVG